MSELQSDTIGKIAAALVKAQAAMGVAVKDSVNGHFKTNYADLASVMNAARDPLAANDLAVIQRAHPNDRGVCLQTMIVHSSGEWLADGGLTLPAAKADPQGFGSAMTYSRRYGLAAMLGIVQDDDDGAAAVAAQHKAREAAQLRATLPKITDDQASLLARLAVLRRPAGPSYAAKFTDGQGVVAEDFERILRTTLDGCAKDGVLEPAEAEQIMDAARGGMTVDVIVEGYPQLAVTGTGVAA